MIPAAPQMWANVDLVVEPEACVALHGAKCNQLSVDIEFAPRVCGDVYWPRGWGVSGTALS